MDERLAGNAGEYRIIEMKISFRDAVRWFFTTGPAGPVAMCCYAICALTIGTMALVVLSVARR